MTKWILFQGCKVISIIKRTKNNKNNPCKSVMLKEGPHDHTN